MPTPDDIAILRRALELVLERQDLIKNMIDNVLYLSVDEDSAVRRTQRLNNDQRAWERVEQLAREALVSKGADVS